MIRLIDAAQHVARRIGDRVRLVAPTLPELPGCGELMAAKIVARLTPTPRFGGRPPPPRKRPASVLILSCMWPLLRRHTMNIETKVPAKDLTCLW